MAGSSSNTGETALASKPIFIFDSARTRSHLFFRYLSTHPELHPIEHPYVLPRLLGQDNIWQHLQHSDLRAREVDDQARSPDTYESAQKDFDQGLEEAAANGKTPLISEHWFDCTTLDLTIKIIRGQVDDIAQLAPNPTMIPDRIWEALTPIILIRHPALVIDSNYRASLSFTHTRPGDEDFLLMTKNIGSRLLFDHFRSRGREPIVADGEDTLWRTKEMSANLFGKLGLDWTGLSETWEPVSKEEMDKKHPMVQNFTRDVYTSKGIQRSAEKVRSRIYPNIPSGKQEADAWRKQPEAPLIDAFYEKWAHKYGVDIAGQLKEVAEANMPHYEYLCRFKV